MVMTQRTRRFHRNQIVIVLVVSTVFVMLSSRLSLGMSTSAKSPKAALIFLHGLGDGPSGWSSLQAQLPRIKPSLKDLTYVFPPAPTIGITINGGATMPGWFDVLDWPIGISARDDRPGKLLAVEQIEQEVQKLESEGFTRDRIAVGGFSQGGAIALLAAYRQKEQKFAACVALSGWLTLTDELAVSDVAKKTPLFWAHGEYDDKVLFEQQAHGVAKLREQGVDVTAESYPMGHSSDPEEIERLASFLDEVFFGGNSS